MRNVSSKLDVKKNSKVIITMAVKENRVKYKYNIVSDFIK